MVEVHKSDSIVWHDLITLHRFVNLLCHLESTVFVASFYQQIEHVDLEIDAVFGLEFPDNLSELVQPEKALAWILFLQCEAPKINPRVMNINTLFAVFRDFYSFRSVVLKVNLNPWFHVVVEDGF
jgi:hypothetical protein